MATTIKIQTSFVKNNFIGISLHNIVIFPVPAMRETRMPFGLQTGVGTCRVQALVPGQFDDPEEEEEWQRDIYNRPSGIERQKNSGNLESGNGNGERCGVLGNKRLLLEDVLLGINDGLDSCTTTYSSMDSSASTSNGMDYSMTNDTMDTSTTTCSTMRSLFLL